MGFDEEGLLTGKYREKKRWTKKVAAAFISKEAKLDRNLIHLVFLYLSISVLVVWTFISRDNSWGCHDPSIGFYCKVSAKLKWITSEAKYSFHYEAPASNVIKYETRVSSENFVNKGPYMSGEDGLPTDATDVLWEDLYQCTTPHAKILPFFQ